MAERNGLISYDGLPISSGGGHGLGRLRAIAAWKAVQQFLSTCTTATVPKRVTIEINELSEVDPVTIASLRDSAKKTLNVSSHSHRQQDYGEKGSTFSWDLSPALAESAVMWLAAAEPLTSNWLGGPAKIVFDYQFRLRSSDGVELPFQRNEDYLGQAYNGYGILIGESGCRLTLSARSAFSLVLFFPFEEPNAAFWEYASFLQNNLPMKLSQHHWKHWKLTKKKIAYISRRIAPSSL